MKSAHFSLTIFSISKHNSKSYLPALKIYNSALNPKTLNSKLDPSWNIIREKKLKNLMLQRDSEALKKKKKKIEREVVEKKEIIERRRILWFIES
jgi:hypothetical protein